MQTIVIGTAGHIDHGKSALVKALTGTDPDRLKEEQERGITIDLGFAQFTSGETQVAFVDVPGHERFVRNMLAGAGGIDAVVLVIDAGESVMPQTREHFEICRLLGIDRGVIALTKADVVEASAIARAREAATDLVTGSFLDGARVIEVSARTGQGLDDLRRALVALAGLPPRQQRIGLVRLPIDRAFTIRGFGAVVTGTLVSGEISEGDALVVLPEGRAARVRGLQAHGRRTSRVRAPQRTAVNLAGIDIADLRRGHTLATPGTLSVTSRADVVIRLLGTAPPLRHGARIRAHHGAAEIPARVSLSATRATDQYEWSAVRAGEAGAKIPSGGEAFARLRFDVAAVLTRDDRLVLRLASPATTIGGARVLDPEPPAAGVRRKATLERFLRLAVPRVPIDLLVVESGAFGVEAFDLVRRGGLDLYQAEARLAEEVASGRAILIGPRAVSAAVVQALEARVQSELDGYHAARPMEAGLVPGALRDRLGARVPEWLFAALLGRLSSRGVIRGHDRLALSSHQPAMSPERGRLLERVERAIRDGGLTPPDAQALAAGLPAAATEVEQAVQWLVRERRVARIGDLVFHHDVLMRLKADVQADFSAKPVGTRVTLDVGAFKTRFRLTRKHAIPLLEWLDRERVTRRLGDVRVVL